MSIKLASGLISLGKANGYYRINLGKLSKQLTGRVKYLQLGLKVSQTNVTKALEIANRIDAMLSEDVKNSCVDLTFERYNPKTHNILNEIKCYRYYIDNFEEPYFETRKITPQSKNTLNRMVCSLVKECENYLDAVVTPENLKAILLQAPHGSCRRKTLLRDLNLMLKHFPELRRLKLTLEFDIASYGKDYEPVERNLPSDDEIIAGFYKIQEILPNSRTKKTPEYLERMSSWGWVYGILATYGLRPHELLAVDIDKSFAGDDNELVLDESLCEGTKTGGRIVYPIMPEWVKLFGLEEVKNPNNKQDLLAVLRGKKVRVDRNRKDAVKTKQKGTKVPSLLQNAVTGRFTHQKMPFSPYDLRHAYAVRGYRLGIDISCMAKMMGHTIRTHERCYQKYMDADTLKKPYLLAIKGFNKSMIENLEIQRLLQENEKLAEANRRLLNYNYELMGEVSDMRKVMSNRQYYKVRRK